MFAIHENQHQLEGDVFDEFRIGLDHIAFGCASREELESWLARPDALGIEHGEILDRSYGGRSRISGPGQHSARVLSVDGFIGCRLAPYAGTLGAGRFQLSVLDRKGVGSCPRHTSACATYTVSPSAVIAGPP
jgi:hypothetical protein